MVGMSTRKTAKKSAVAPRGSRSGAAADLPIETAFGEVVDLIRAARQRAAQVVNTELIDLYWRIGQYLHHKIAADGWAQSTVVQLAAYIAQREAGLRGFSPQNLWRMRQFFEAYSVGGVADAKLSTLLRVLPWSSHLHILSRAKRPEEREFYIRMAAQQRWQVREVARQIDSGLFERAVLNPPKLSTALRESQPLGPCSPFTWRCSQQMRSGAIRRCFPSSSIHQRSLAKTISTWRRCSGFSGRRLELTIKLFSRQRGSQLVPRLRTLRLLRLNSPQVLFRLTSTMSRSLAFVNQ